MKAVKRLALLATLAVPVLGQDDCNIANLFSHLSDITSSPECCPVGSCDGGFPGTADGCTTECGVVFEPFWDEVRGQRWACREDAVKPASATSYKLLYLRCACADVMAVWHCA